MEAMHRVSAIVNNSSRTSSSCLRLALSRSRLRSAHRSFSSLPERKDGDDVVVVYQRNTDRNAGPRLAFGLSSINTVYWLWYSLDFIPAVNASPIDDLHIDPNMGWGGLALGLLINSVTMLYPISLISKMKYSPSTQTWQVYQHDLPLIQPSSTYVSFPLGSLTMDRKSSDTKNILANMKGDLLKYQGHLGLSAQGKQIPFLLEIREPTEVHDGELMLEGLLNPQLMKQEAANMGKPKKRRGGKKSKRSKR